MPVKRPAAKEGSNHTQKKSKTGEDEERNVALSKEALANHEKFLEELAKKEEMSEKDFSQSLAKLPEKQVQLLWKKFEASRKSSDQDKKYKEETNGAGSVAKKKSLLLHWAMHKHCKGAMMKLSLDKSHGVERAWVSKKKCEEDLGLEEMKLRLSAGTLKWRRFPEDPRFFQFQATTEKEATYLHKQKEAHRKVEGTGSLTEAMAFNQLMDDDDLDERHFDLSQAAPSKPLGLDDGLAAAMGLKARKRRVQVESRRRMRRKMRKKRKRPKETSGTRCPKSVQGMARSNSRRDWFVQSRADQGLGLSGCSSVQHW